MSWNPGSAIDCPPLSLSSLLSAGTVTPTSPEGSGDLNQMISMSIHPVVLNKCPAKEAAVIIIVFIKLITSFLNVKIFLHNIFGSLRHLLICQKMTNQKCWRKLRNSPAGQSRLLAFCMNISVRGEDFVEMAVVESFYGGVRHPVM